MEIPNQHDIYIWANYSVSSYLKCIPICWNGLIWLKYDFMHIFPCTLTYNLWDHCADTGSWIRGQIRIFAPYLPWGPTLTVSYYWTCKNQHIATKYVIIVITFNAIWQILGQMTKGSNIKPTHYNSVCITVCTCIMFTQLYKPFHIDTFRPQKKYVCFRLHGLQN